MGVDCVFATKRSTLFGKNGTAYLKTRKKILFPLRAVLGARGIATFFSTHTAFTRARRSLHHREKMSCTPTCEGYSGAGSSCGPLVLDDAGMVVASAPPLNIYDSVWSPLSAGNYSLLREPSAAELCDGPADPSAWAGKLILGGKFAIRTLCPYRQRALVAAQAGAAGILFRGKPHSPFDWSGWAVDSASLAPAAGSSACRLPTGAHRCVRSSVRVRDHVFALNICETVAGPYAMHKHETRHQIPPVSC